jgi:hypothetical protein
MIFVKLRNTEACRMYAFLLYIVTYMHMYNLNFLRSREY